MEETKKEFAVDIDKIVVRIHNKIALWNNEDGSTSEKTTGLKILSQDIVYDILSDVFSQMGDVKTKVRVESVPRQKKDWSLKGLFKRK